MNNSDTKIVPIEELSPLLLGLINDGTDVVFNVTGNSMKPFWYNRRDSVVLTKCDPKALKKGQVPLYRRDNGQYVLHRIVKVKENTYDMIGDRQTEIEYDVPKENVLCVVKAFYRRGKYHSCDEIPFHIYSSIWMFLIPLRGVLFKLNSFRMKLLKGGHK